ncbi:MAG: oligosaccharide flippase family protein, partial [Bacteroidales bacterium]|nr:oligosaccharide flippase family protein [Bacteroidales bacterium]
MSDLKKKAINGAIWSSLNRFGGLGISFITNIILARLLTPDDFGILGVLFVFIALSQAFIDGGFAS